MRRRLEVGAEPHANRALVDDSEAASRPRRLQSRRRKPFHADDRKRGLRRQEPRRTPAAGLCRARRADGRARPRSVDPRHRTGRMMMATIDSGILQTITPVTHDLGEFKVHRTLPARERTMVGPFIFVDQFGPARLPAGQGMDVRPHPHINLATVTYLFEGAIEHRDSIGSHAVIEPGAINLMTAGSGHRPFRALARQRCARPGRASTACRPGSRCPTASEEIDPAFDHVASRRPAAGRRRRRARAGADGDVCGARPPRPAAIRRPSTPTSSSTPGGVDPDRCRGRRARRDAGRRRGRARRRSRSSSSRSTCSRPGHRRAAVERERRRG